MAISSYDEIYDHLCIGPWTNPGGKEQQANSFESGSKEKAAKLYSKDFIVWDYSTTSLLLGTGR